MDPHELTDAIIAGNAKAAKELTAQALDEGFQPLDLVSRFMIPAMDEVGRRFDAEEYFFTDLFVAARAMKAAIEPIRPLLAAHGAPSVGKVLIGTVENDLHDIGKNLVAAVLEGAGFEVIDLGVDVPVTQFVSEAKKHCPDIIALSSLLTVTLTAVRDTILALEREGLRECVKIMVGGAAVTREFAELAGADEYAQNATVALTVAQRLVTPSAGRPGQCSGNESAV